ncbi:hypothetical protein [Pedobacter sp. ASV28]|uniref:hypothetical protein n=1 Tax=Pedobacter sp. ASV28 TaxID=2795123 RepID=UPI0018EB7858|nr:hypothetical protein [Pedobacter sp. ASV28]
MERRLPRLEILGTVYEVDIKARKMIPLNAPLYVKVIDFSSLEVQYADKNQLAAYYDQVSKNVIDIPESLTELPKGMDVIGIMMPSLANIDPVGCAELLGLDYNTSPYVHVPIKEMHHAQTIPLEKTLLWEHIYGDLYSQEQEQNGDRKQKEETMENKEMERKLPGIMMEGNAFLIDVMKEEFRDLSNKANVISFEMLQYNDTGYSLLYDPIVKNVPGSDRYGHPDIKTITIPPFTILDPEGMALKYNKPIEQVTGKSDFEVIVDQELYAKRMAGHLPTIEILDHTFYTDLTLGTLRPKDDFTTMGIKFSEMQTVPFLMPEHYWFYYNPKTHAAETIDHQSITELPKDIVVVEVPVESKLDPVRIAQIYELDVNEFLMKNPIVANMKARVVPWSETGLPNIIKENNQRLGKVQTVKQGENKKQVPKKRRSKGL